MTPTDLKNIKQNFISNRAWYGLWAGLIALKLVLAYFHPEPAAPDEGTYIGLAQGLLADYAYLNVHGHPTAGVMPGFPFFLAAVMAVSGGSIMPMYFINALLTVAIAWAAGKFLFLMTGNRPLSRWCMLIAYLFPPFFTYAWHAMTEIPFTASLMMLFVYWEKTRRQPLVATNWFFLGLFTVVSFMIRPVLFLLTPVFFAWPLIVARLHWRAIAGAAVGTAVVFMLWMPWVYRNYKTFGGFVPLATTSGLAFWAGTIGDSSRVLAEQLAENARSGISDKTHDELTVSRHFAQVAKRNYERDKWGYYRRAINSSWRLWPTAYSGRYGSFGDMIKERNWIGIGIKFVFLGLNLTMLAGVACAFWIFLRNPRWWPYMLVIVYFHVMHAIILPEPRYSLPLTPMMIAMGLAAVNEIYNRIHARKPA